MTINLASAGDKSIRVVHVIDGLGNGGAERLLAIYAPRLQKIGCDVHVIVLNERNGNPQQKIIEAAGVPTIHVPVEKLRNVRQIAHFWSTLKSLKPDVIHAHLQFSSILTSLLGRLNSIPSVATIHTLEKPGFSNRGGLRKWIMYKTLERFCNRVICLSESAAQFARQNGLARARIDVLPNGIDLAEFLQPSETAQGEIRRELGIAEQIPLILVVAVLRPLKGIDRLIRAFPAILRDFGKAQLLVVGDGPEMENLVNLAQELNVSESVVFAGQRSDVPSLMSIADVFVLPTLDDAQPTVIMEAMAARLPVIASRVGGIPDMISDGTDGILVAPDEVGALEETLMKLLANTSQQDKLAAAGRKTVEEKFSLEGQVARLNTLYRTLLSETSKRD